VDEALDEKVILERIRAHLRSGPSRAPVPAAPAEADENDIAVDLAAVRDAQDIYALPLRSQRTGLGPALGEANRILRKLLRPSLERQVSYNTANARLVQALLHDLESLKQAHAALERRCDALQAELAAVSAKRGG